MERKRVSYRTVVREASTELIEKRSRFLACVRPLTPPAPASETQAIETRAQEFIAARKKEYWDASHNVYAYSLREGQIRRFSDDGEPQGTAGMPVLDVLSGAELVDCVVVVTRYFGGVLLGTGGLARAYAAAAGKAVAAAGTVEMVLCDRMAVTSDYGRYGRVSSLIAAQGGVLVDTQFTDAVRLEFLVPGELTGAFRAALTDATAGGLDAAVLGEGYHPFPAE